LKSPPLRGAFLVFKGLAYIYRRLCKKKGRIKIPPALYPISYENQEYDTCIMYIVASGTKKIGKNGFDGFYG